MFSFQANLKTIENVKHFVQASANMSCDIEIKAGPYIVDGKSIMGIFSLNRMEPVTILVHGDEAAHDKLKSAVNGF